MKRYDDAEESEIFQLFTEIAGREKLFDKTAEYDATESMWNEPGNRQLDLPMTALAGEHSKLYDITGEDGEDLVRDAHPGGGTKTQLDHKPEKDLGKIETIVEQHKVNRDIAESTPTGKLASLAEQLMKLASVMDEAGFSEEADQLDTLIAHIADKTAAEIPPDEVRQELGAVKKDLSNKGVNVGFNPAGGGSTANSPLAPSSQPTDWKAAPDQGTDELQQGGFDFNNPQLMQQAEQQLRERQTAAQSLQARRQQEIRTNNMRAQQLLNKYRGQVELPAIPLSGIMDDSFRSALSDFGIQEGSYHNWNELYQLIQNAGRNKVSGYWSQYFAQSKPNKVIFPPGKPTMPIDRGSPLGHGDVAFPPRK